MAANVLRSSDVVAGAVRTIVERGHASAGAAYNVGSERSGVSGVIAFVHQDVYLPSGWANLLLEAIRFLDRTDPDWAVLGPFGLTPIGQNAGRVWSSGLGAIVGQKLDRPAPVVSLDELVLVLRADSGLKFDANLPGYHLYGTDIVQTALAVGRTAYAFDGPVIHNSRTIRRLDSTYRRAYRYMQRKWRARLPIPTSCMRITRWGTPLYRDWIRSTMRSHLGLTECRERHPDPAKLASELGFEIPLEQQPRMPIADCATTS